MMTLIRTPVLCCHLSAFPRSMKKVLSRALWGARAGARSYDCSLPLEQVGSLGRQSSGRGFPSCIVKKRREAGKLGEREEGKGAFRKNRLCKVLT